MEQATDVQMLVGRRPMFSIRLAPTYEATAEMAVPG
jgi:hypothetical protein